MSELAQEPMWDWFELSYSSYLVLPRSLLCGMPVEWQRRMVGLLEEMRGTYDGDALVNRYTVHARGPGNRYVMDPWREYRHPPPLPYRKAAP